MWRSFMKKWKKKRLCGKFFMQAAFFSSDLYRILGHWKRWPLLVCLSLTVIYFNKFKYPHCGLNRTRRSGSGTQSMIDLADWTLTCSVEHLQIDQSPYYPTPYSTFTSRVEANNTTISESGRQNPLNIALKHSWANTKDAFCSLVCSLDLIWVQLEQSLGHRRAIPNFSFAYFLHFFQYSTRSVPGKDSSKGTTVTNNKNSLIGEEKNIMINPAAFADILKRSKRVDNGLEVQWVRGDALMWYHCKTLVTGPSSKRLLKAKASKSLQCNKERDPPPTVLGGPENFATHETSCHSSSWIISKRFLSVKVPNLWNHDIATCWEKTKYAICIRPTGAYMTTHTTHTTSYNKRTNIHKNRCKQPWYNIDIMYIYINRYHARGMTE